MNFVKLISTAILILSLWACSNEPKESDKLLTDYKKQHLDKAKKLEVEVNKRTENLNKQLEELEHKKKDDPQ